MFNMNPGMGGYPSPPQYPQFGNRMAYNQFVPSTNKRFVRSLEEALSLPADLNSQNVYFDANENVAYDICTNGRGEKSWAVFDIVLRQSSTKVSGSVTNSIDERFTQLENKLEEFINGKYNAKPADATNASPV